LENQLTLAVACKDKNKILKYSVKVSETTNTILQKNAEMLKQNNIEVARENENTI
jgi:uncharacterized protein YaaN involved in tellurite resistance